MILLCRFIKYVTLGKCTKGGTCPFIHPGAQATDVSFDTPAYGMAYGAYDPYQVAALASYPSTTTTHTVSAKAPHRYPISYI